jgi:hypothetical protein
MPELPIFLPYRAPRAGNWLSDDMDGFAIDENLVRSLVREQHPDLAGLELRAVDGGWDNQLWRLGDELAVRMPRTERAPSLLRKEHRWMPVLAPLLPLPVPDLVRIGEPSDRFPGPWTITTWVPGEPADRTPVTHRNAADRLAGFLSALHQPAPAEAPANPDRGVPLATLTYDFKELPQAVNGLGGVAAPSLRRGAAIPRRVRERRRGDGPARARVGGPARHRPHRHRAGRGPGPPRRQDDVGARRAVGARPRAGIDLEGHRTGR